MYLHCHLYSIYHPSPADTRQHSAPSPLTQPSPTLSRETGSAGAGLGGAGSGYAVTYRRGGGACVSVVSGGGVQGTYSRLDSGEHTTDSQPPPPRSPGLASRAERRAGMHISGPFSVTVPLHITSGLALGVLQGGALREEGGAQREEGGAKSEEGGAHRENGGSRMEESGEGRREKERKRDESREGGAEGKQTEVSRSEEDKGIGSGEERAKEEIEPVRAAAAEDELDYVGEYEENEVHRSALTVDPLRKVWGFFFF